MGYIEALEDGIRITKNGMNIFYHPKCIKCKTEILVRSYIRTNTYICKKCKSKAEFLKKHEKIERKQRQFKNALQLLKKHLHKVKGCIADYKEAISVVSEKLNLSDSKEEMLVAVILEKAGINYIQQKNVLVYSVDFMLPEEKIVLEIDGELYHNYLTYEKDKIKNEEIQIALGEEWLIIRLTDHVIDRNSLYLQELFYELKSTDYIRNENNNYDYEYMKIYQSHETNTP